jgi:NADH-quinone oxidoreductase subunit E
VSEGLRGEEVACGVRRLVICTNIHCVMNGSEELIDHLLLNYGVVPGLETETGLLVEEACCFAACELGPNVDIDGVIYDGVTPAQLDDLLAGSECGRHALGDRGRTAQVAGGEST